MKITKQIITSGIYGLAIGDAIGVPYEFSSREKIATSPCVDMVGYGVYNKPAGTFSDDTSMTLALMDGLTEMKQDGDYSPVMNKFLAWFNNDEYTVDGLFGIGRTCMNAIINYTKGIAPTECGGRDKLDNGNGSLMRILPAVLFFLAKYKGCNYDFIDDMSALTHGHYISKTACKIYSKIVQAILEKKPINESIIIAVTEIDTQCSDAFDRLRSVDFFNLSESAIKSSGYVVDTLEASIWCFGNTSNYKDCVLRAVNLGLDTDTVAAVAGSLAGLYYGINTIPKVWVERLRAKEIINVILDKFFCYINE